ncbi:MAG: hypothetical protein Q9162_000281 [Coniocarpon cinnabarinum]
MSKVQNVTWLVAPLAIYKDIGLTNVSNEIHKGQSEHYRMLTWAQHWALQIGDHCYELHATEENRWNVNLRGLEKKVPKSLKKVSHAIQKVTAKIDMRIIEATEWHAFWSNQNPPIHVDQYPVGQTSWSTDDLKTEARRIWSEYGQENYNLMVRNCQNFVRTFWDIISPRPDQIIASDEERKKWHLMDRPVGHNLADISTNALQSQAAIGTIQLFTCALFQVANAGGLEGLLLAESASGVASVGGEALLASGASTAEAASSNALVSTGSTGVEVVGEGVGAESLVSGGATGAEVVSNTVGGEALVSSGATGAEVIGGGADTVHLGQAVSATTNANAAAGGSAVTAEGGTATGAGQTATASTSHGVVSTTSAKGGAAGTKGSFFGAKGGVAGTKGGAVGAKGAGMKGVVAKASAFGHTAMHGAAATKLGTIGKLGVGVAMAHPVTGAAIVTGTMLNAYLIYHKNRAESYVKSKRMRLDSTLESAKQRLDDHDSLLYKWIERLQELLRETQKSKGKKMPLSQFDLEDLIYGFPKDAGLELTEDEMDRLREDLDLKDVPMDPEKVEEVIEEIERQETNSSSEGVEDEEVGKNSEKEMEEVEKQMREDLGLEEMVSNKERNEDVEGSEKMDAIVEEEEEKRAGQLLLQEGSAQVMKEPDDPVADLRQCHVTLDPLADRRTGKIRFTESPPSPKEGKAQGPFPSTFIKLIATASANVIGIRPIKASPARYKTVGALS